MDFCPAGQGDHHNKTFAHSHTCVCLVIDRPSKYFPDSLWSLWEAFYCFCANKMLPCSSYTISLILTDRKWSTPLLSSQS